MDLAFKVQKPMWQGWKELEKNSPGEKCKKECY